MAMLNNQMVIAEYWPFYLSLYEPLPVLEDDGPIELSKTSNVAFMSTTALLSHLFVFKSSMFTMNIYEIRKTMLTESADEMHDLMLVSVSNLYGWCWFLHRSRCSGDSLAAATKSIQQGDGTMAMCEFHQ